MRTLKNLLLFLVSLFLGMVGLETGLRIFVPGMEDLSAPRADKASPVFFKPDKGQPDKSEQYDPYLGWVNRAGVSGTGYGPDKSVSRVEINSRGLRDREIEYEKPPGVKRIVVLGDSFAWGHGLNAKERFSDLLDRDFPGTQVINMGVVGYSTDQECLLFEREGIKYEPDLVILLVHDTDIFHNGLRANYGKAKPYFRLRGGRLECYGIPVPRESGSPLEGTEDEGGGSQDFENRGLLHFVKKRILARSRLYQLLGSRLKMIGPVNDLLVKLKLVERGRAVGEDVRLTGAIIERLRKQVKNAGGGDLLALLVPSKETVNYHLPGGSGKKLILKIKDGEIVRREEAIRDLTDFLKAGKIAFIDLTPVFIEASTGGTNLYFIHDNHWNGKANKIAARLLGAYLRQEGFNYSLLEKKDSREKAQNSQNKIN